MDHAFYTGRTIFAHDLLTVPLSRDRYDVASSSSPTNPEEAPESKLKKHRHSATRWQSLNEIMDSRRIGKGDKDPAGVADLLAILEDIATTAENAANISATSDQESAKEGKGEAKGKGEEKGEGIRRQMEDVREDSMDSETVPRSSDGDQERR